MISCTKTISFDAAHRIPKHQGYCRMLHGHHYKVEVTFSADKVDDLGMVIDFSIIKNRLKKWIDQYWDHNVLLHKSDKDLGDSITKYTTQEIFYMDDYPTAENMAIFLMKNVCPQLFKDVSCSKIRLYETPTSYAEVNAIR